jgi:hypothetical protein
MDIRRTGELIGHLNWHPTRFPLVELMQEGRNYLSINEMKQVISKMEEIQNNDFRAVE